MSILNSIQQILKLQQLFYQKYLTPQLLNELISLYVNVIECFDETHAPFRQYFLGKIQFVLSRQQTMKMLGGKKQNQSKIRQTIRLSEVATHIMHEHNLQKDIKIINYNNINEQAKNKQRNNKINLQIKIMKEVQQTIQNVTKEVISLDQKHKQHGLVIGNMIQQQQNQLNQRLANRKKKLRKKSVENKNNNQETIQYVVKKEQLVNAQKLLNIAVDRFTIRMTNRMTKILPQNQSPQKGRVSKKKIQQDQQAYEEKTFKKKTNLQDKAVNSNKDQGRVTIRKKNQEEDS